MEILPIDWAVRNAQLQHRKMARMGPRYHTNPDLIRSLERPAGMAWRAAWSFVNGCKGIL